MRGRRDAHLSRSSHTGSSFSALPMMTRPVAWRRVESWMRREIPGAHRLLGAVRKRCSVGRWIERWGRWHRSIHVVGDGGEWLAGAASDIVTRLSARRYTLLGPSLINDLRLKSHLTWRPHRAAGTIVVGSSTLAQSSLCHFALCIHSACANRERAPMQTFPEATLPAVDGSMASSMACSPP